MTAATFRYYSPTRVDLQPQKNDGEPVYTMEALERMNNAFAQAMLAAIERGEECCATAISTAPGTRWPILMRVPV
jgi:hypothetical protein